MSFFRRTAILLAALVFTFAAGCSKNNSSSQTDDSSVSESSVTEDSSAQDESSEREPVQTEPGEKLKAAAKFFESDKYEFVCKVSGIGADAVLSIVKTPGMYSQITDYGFGKAYVYCNGAETYRYDDITKSYVYEIGKITTDPNGNTISETVNKKLPQTKTHINSDYAEKYDVEEYTYTASSYITVLDFYFDKQKGTLSKYTVNYSVEGKDDETEVRDVTKMETSNVSKVEFNSYKIKADYTDFKALTETKRDEFCRATLEKVGAKEEDLLEAGITMFDLKKISYDDFSAFIIGFTAKKKQ